MSAQVVQPGSEPLGAHTRFRTSETEKARYEAARVLSSHDLRVLEDDGSLDATLNAASLGPLTLCYLRYGTVVEVGTNELGAYVALNVPLVGHMRVEHRRREYVAYPGRAAVFSPEGRLRMRWSGELEQLILRVDAAALSEHLAILAPNARDRQLRFSPEMDLTGPAAAVAGAISLVRDLLEREITPQALPSTVVARVVEVVLTALLVSQPGAHSAEMLRIPAPADARTVRRAVEFIQVAPETIGAVSEIAAAVGVSMRTLQAAFRSELAQSPAEYLRRVRLARAHEALLAAEPDSGESVISIALRHGFVHAGRFAAAYRQRYGQAPGVTLRR